MEAAYITSKTMFVFPRIEETFPVTETTFHCASLINTAVFQGAIHPNPLTQDTNSTFYPLFTQRFHLNNC